VFLFPAHSWATTYDLPIAEVDAFAATIGPRLEETA
jgi:5,10-methylenetetrahydromethanopterin reductase